MKRHSVFLPLLIAASVVLAAGCEHSSSGPHSSSTPAASTSSDIVGTWKLVEGSSTSGWYAFFEAGGAWYIKDTLSSANKHVYGTYSAKKGSFSGSMVNPGVGTGEINGTYAGDTMTFNFVEHWHSPHKTIVYSGTRQ